MFSSNSLYSVSVVYSSSLLRCYFIRLLVYSDCRPQYSSLSYVTCICALDYLVLLVVAVLFAYQVREYKVQVYSECLYYIAVYLSLSRLFRGGIRFEPCLRQCMKRRGSVVSDTGSCRFAELATRTPRYQLVLSKPCRSLLHAS